MDNAVGRLHGHSMAWGDRMGEEMCKKGNTMQLLKVGREFLLF